MEWISPSFSLWVCIDIQWQTTTWDWSFWTLLEPLQPLLRTKFSNSSWVTCASTVARILQVASCVWRYTCVGTHRHTSSNSSALQHLQSLTQHRLKLENAGNLYAFAGHTYYTIVIIDCCVLFFCSPDIHKWRKPLKPRLKVKLAALTKYPLLQ